MFHFPIQGAMIIVNNNRFYALSGNVSHMFILYNNFTAERRVSKHMQKFIESSLTYIEQNLKTDITADELAAHANYSTGHFCRLFAKTMDTTVASYVLKRRLDHALAEIKLGKTAISVVLEYGFDTYAGFYKAFVKMYGCSPKKYLNIYKNKGGFIMQNISNIRNILNNWDIDANVHIEDITHTEWTTQQKSEWKVWQIDEDFYLKTNERSKMIRNIKIAKAMHKQGLLSEFLPLQTKQGEDYVDGEHIFILTHKIGKPLNLRPLNDNEIRHLENNSLREKYGFQLGVAIAKLHKSLKSVQNDVKPHEDNLYKQGLKAIPAIKSYLPDISDDFFTDYTETFANLHSSLPKQLIHGNLCGDTAVYENGDVIAFKGFETYNLSFPRIYDVIWGAGEINAQPQINVYLNTLSDMLKGYNSITPLTAEEKQSVYYILCINYLKGCAYYEKKGITLDLSQRSIKALLFLAKNKELFFNLL